MWDDPIRWVSREYNEIADHLANYTLDLGKSWSIQYGETKFSSTQNLVGFADGGARKTCSASAWIAGYVDCGNFKPITSGGVFHPTPTK